MILNNDWTPEDWRLEVSGPMSPYNVSWDFLSAPILIVPVQNLSVWFQYEVLDDKQIFGNGSEVLTIYFDDLQVMNSYQYNFEMINATVPFNIFPRESTRSCGIGVMNLVVQSMVMIIIALSL